MIKLIFTIQRETFTIEIDNRIVYYIDRKTKRIRLVPEDENINMLVIMSRNSIPKEIIQWFKLTDEEKKEYDSCQTDEQIAELCIRDAKSKGAILAKRE